jgi:hypothetical protein
MAALKILPWLTRRHHPVLIASGKAGQRWTSA